LKGSPGKGIPISLTAVNDPISFALSVKNSDPTASRAFVVYKADSTVLFSVDVNGVQASPDGVLPASQLATLAGAQTFTNKTFVTPTFSGGLTVTGLTNDASTAALTVKTLAGTVLINARDDGLVDMSAATVKITNFTQMQHTHADVANGGPINSAPTGTVVDFAATTPPTGWLVCDGSAVSRTTYAALFAVIGTTWGAGNGTTTFNLPDLRSRVTVGAGSGSGLTARTLAAVGGEENHALSAAELAAHTHTQTDGAHAHTVTVTDPTHNHTQAAHLHAVTDPTHSHVVLASTSQTVQSGTGKNVVGLVTGATDPASTGVTVNNATATNVAGATGITAAANSASAGIGANTGSNGSGTAHNTMPPWVCLNRIIRT
jgi:microcystin-dependent protein